MNIIITGACGHIGSFFVENIDKIKKIKKIILIDNLISNKTNSLFKIKTNKKISFYNLDVGIKNNLNQFKNIDIIFHFASMTNAAGSFKVKKQMFKNNLDCFHSVVNFCELNKTKLVHISSTSVYGKHAKIFDENCEKKFLKPQSPYAKIKLIEENILKKKNISYKTFRFGTIAGVSKGMRFHSSVNSFCFSAAINVEIKVYKTALNQYRPYLSLNDAFKLFKFCIEKKFFKNDIFNVVSGNFTVKQIIKKIKKNKKNIKIKLTSSPIMNQLSYHTDKKKLTKEGLALNSNLDKEIEKTLKLFSNINK
jgi:nucleoside-diphosphate-sugar epimerase